MTRVLNTSDGKPCRCYCIDCGRKGVPLKECHVHIRETAFKGGIGLKLEKILPDKIQIRTDDAEFANARLNDPSFPHQTAKMELVTMTTAITDNDVETHMDEGTPSWRNCSSRL